MINDFCYFFFYVLDKNFWCFIRMENDDIVCRIGVILLYNLGEKRWEWGECEVWVVYEGKCVEK